MNDASMFGAYRAPLPVPEGATPRDLPPEYQARTIQEDTEMTRPYVAYDPKTGVPWAVSTDRDKIFDYAEKHDLRVLDVDDLDKS